MFILILIKWRIANYLPRRDKLPKSFAIHSLIMRNEDYERVPIKCETKQKRNETKRNQRNETKRNEINKNETKRNEINEMKTK